MNARLTFSTLLIFFTTVLFAQTDSFDKKFSEHFGNVEVATFSMNGKIFATGGWDNMVNVYSGDSQELVSSLYGHGGAVTSISIARNNQMIVSGGKDRKVNLWLWDTLEQYFVLDTTVAIHQQPISKVIVGPGMRTIFSASTDGEIHINNLKSKKSKVIKHNSEIHSIAISNNRQKIYVADLTTALTIYNPFGKVITTYEGHSDQINCIAVARNNRFVVTGSSDKTIIVWDVMKGKKHMQLEGHDWKVRSVDISFDSKFMVSGSIDGVCILWNLQTGEQIKKFSVSNGQVKSVAISPNGEYIVAAIAFEDHPDFGETGAVIWKTGHVAPKRKARPKSKAKPSGKSASSKKSNSSSEAKTKGNGQSGKVIKKDDQIEISIE